MDTLSALKTRIQQDLAKEIKNNGKAQMKSSATAQVNRSKIPGMARHVTAVQTKQEQLGDSPSTPNNISTTATVTLRGPKVDQESKKKRACE